MKRTTVLFPADIKAIAEATAEHLNKMQDKVLTLAEMAKKLGRSEEAVRKLVERGKLPCHRLDRKLYFSDKETTEYLLGDKGAGIC